MSGVAPTRNVFEFAIDSALVRHVGKLFDTFATDLEFELSANPEELRNSAVPGARKRFERKFDIAMLTHSEMISVMKAKHAE